MVAMIYEWRVYTANEGCFERMKQRFVDHTARILARHGIALLGLFEAPDGDGKLYYLTAHADEASRDNAWAAFKADEEWQTIKRESETDGPLLSDQSALTLAAVIAPPLPDTAR
ncbi:NIPSNAP family protein [Tepidamorphus sp. 3E244]|uniref:NIPSNAP family protein n=1 Tax=Tepidamorphus sp. 3E244 TaxID=3385498 RepID=UPI0038FD03D1